MRGGGGERGPGGARSRVIPAKMLPPHEASRGAGGGGREVSGVRSYRKVSERGSQGIA